MTDSMTQLERYMVQVEECPDCGMGFTEAELSMLKECPGCKDEDNE